MLQGGRLRRPNPIQHEVRAFGAHQTPLGAFGARREGAYGALSFFGGRKSVVENRR